MATPVVTDEITVPADIRDALILAERRRAVGLVLAYIGVHRLAHNDRVVAVLESLATELEHPELKG